ncbi:MAG TPA: DNA-processing protein DprA [Capillimicrobium sp.]|nr:DNA-processing protein DprA [Capillimicrobium sp.]
MSAACPPSAGVPSGPPPATPQAGDATAWAALPCARCLRRTWLLGALAGRIEHARRDRGARRIPLLLALADEALLRALEPPRTVVAGYEGFDPGAALEAADRAGLTLVCRHDERYPAALRALPDAPAVLHVAGPVERFVALTGTEQPAVAVVGARRASPYGLEVARALGRGLAAADVTVVSGMALGVDAAAHAGALAAPGPTIAVLAGGADMPYPPSKRSLYDAIRARGCVVGELPPGTVARRWCFPARNRIIAGLSRLTVVVEAMERSGSLITAEFARDLGREVGAVPGQVTSPLATGPNALLADGAHVIRRADDALDLACGVGEWRARGPARPAVPGHLVDLHRAVAAGAGSAEALAQSGISITAALAGLAELEVLGLVRRTAGGRYQVAA